VTTAYYKGLTRGHEDAGRYITGGKQERRAVRAYLERTRESDNPFIRGWWLGFTDRCEQRARSIQLGLAPRTIAPSRLFYLVNHSS
jgi:hypothetical protein